MKTKHTPGPWTIRIGDEWSYSVVTDHGELPNGDRSYWTVASINTTRDEKAANLMLIAAAPELLEALMDLCSFDTPLTEDKWINARDAITKATMSAS